MLSDASWSPAAHRHVKPPGKFIHFSALMQELLLARHSSISTKNKSMSIYVNIYKEQKHVVYICQHLQRITVCLYNNNRITIKVCSSSLCLYMSCLSFGRMGYYFLVGFDHHYYECVTLHRWRIPLKCLSCSEQNYREELGPLPTSTALSVTLQLVAIFTLTSKTKENEIAIIQDDFFISVRAEVSKDKNKPAQCLPAVKVDAFVFTVAEQVIFAFVYIFRIEIKCHEKFKGL